MSGSDPPTVGPAPSERAHILQEAVRRARAGMDLAGSFQLLEAELSPRLLRYFRSHSFSREDAEDLVQAALARVWHGLPRLEHEDRFLAWLFAIARNLRRTARAEQRRERSWLAGGADLAEGAADPRSAGMFQERIDAERLAALRAAIERLPARQRQCLLLRLREELSYEEISDTLQLSLRTVRNHLAEAKRNLRELLRKGLALEVRR